MIGNLEVTRLGLANHSVAVVWLRTLKLVTYRPASTVAICMGENVGPASDALEWFVSEHHDRAPCENSSGDWQF